MASAAEAREKATKCARSACRRGLMVVEWPSMEVALMRVYQVDRMGLRVVGEGVEWVREDSRMEERE